MKFTLASLALLFLVPFSAVAQSSYCGTPPGRSEWLQRYQQDKSAFQTRSSDILYIPLTIHLVGSDEGEGYLPVPILLEAVCTINEDFVPANIQFFIEGDIRYIDNDNYFDHNFQQGFQMMQSNNVPNTVNCYFVSSPAGNCGYYSPGGNAVAMAKSCSGPGDHTWSHELGHFFSLPHTFSGWEGTDYSPADPTPAFVNNRQVERVDGSNCANSGDGFCDTPADYLSYRWNCNGQGQSNVQQRDPVDSLFRSDGSLFMSYSNDGCMNRFSNEQIEAMRANINFQRPGLLYDQSAPVYLDTTSVTVISPEEGEIIEGAGGVTLSWEPFPNAIGYAVDLDLFIPVTQGSINFRTYGTSTNSITLTDLQPNRTYLWRVQPYGKYDACTSPGMPSTFSVGTLTTTREEGIESQTQIFPQPLKQGEDLNIQLGQAPIGTVNVQISNTAGQAVRNYALQGQRTLQCSTAGLATGLYVVRISGQGLSDVHKLLIK